MFVFFLYGQYYNKLPLMFNDTQFRFLDSLSYLSQTQHVCVCALHHTVLDKSGHSLIVNESELKYLISPEALELLQITILAKFCNDYQKHRQTQSLPNALIAMDQTLICEYVLW